MSETGATMMCFSRSLLSSVERVDLDSRMECLKGGKWWPLNQNSVVPVNSVTDQVCHAMQSLSKFITQCSHCPSLSHNAVTEQVPLSRNAVNNQVSPSHYAVSLTKCLCHTMQSLTKCLCHAMQSLTKCLCHAMQSLTKCLCHAV